MNGFKNWETWNFHNWYNENIDEFIHQQEAKSAEEIREVIDEFLVLVKDKTQLELYDLYEEQNFIIDSIMASFEEIDIDSLAEAYTK